MEQQQDDFDQKRFLVAMILSGLILVVWQAFFAPPPAPPADTTTQTNAAIEKSADDTTADQADGEPAKLAPSEAAPAEDLPVLTQKLDTEWSNLEFTTRGARMTHASVNKPEQYQVEGDLLKGTPKDSIHYPFGLHFTQNSIALHRDLIWAFDESKSVKSDDGGYEKLVYRHDDPAGRFAIEKRFEAVEDAPYQLDMTVTVQNNSGKTISDNLALDITKWKDPEIETSFLDVRPNEPETICATEDDIERELFSAIETPLAFDETPTKWGAIDSRYFLFSALPAVPSKKCTMEILDSQFLRTRLIQPEFEIASGDAYTSKYRLFVGPKDYDILEQVGAGMENAVDFGIWTFLARPFRWLLVTFHGWVGNWGLAIIMLTFLIRIIIWPINQKVYVNSERMKELQPKLNEIREKYKDDQQRLGEETMKVWKEHGVSPLGCLPMVLQFPIFLSLYFMILHSSELYQADFILWYTDLSSSDPYFVLPILMGIVMFVQQSMMTVETPNPQMATMMKVMPIMFTVFMLFLPSGVVLYYFVSLIIGLVQQFWIRRSYAAKKAQAA